MRRESHKSAGSYADTILTGTDSISATVWNSPRYHAASERAIEQLGIAKELGDISSGQGPMQIVQAIVVLERLDLGLQADKFPFQHGDLLARGSMFGRLHAGKKPSPKHRSLNQTHFTRDPNHPRSELNS